VDLGAGATGVGALSSIDAIAGGTGVDTITGPGDLHEAWKITGADSGAVADVAFSGFENLVGAGVVGNAFQFEEHGTLSGTLSAGRARIGPNADLNSNDDMELRSEIVQVGRRHRAPARESACGPAGAARVDAAFRR
jgi:hypothetical protein